MSQSGIAEAIGKSRAHTTLELNRMKEANLITERLAHVENARSKRKTYNLTPEAVSRERQITEHIHGLELELYESGNPEILNGQQAVDVLMEKISISRLSAFDMILGSSEKIDLDQARLQNSQQN